MALGGKAFVTLTGDVAAVESAVAAGAQAIAQKGLLVNKVVIARPRPELLHEMISATFPGCGPGGFRAAATDDYRRSGQWEGW
jgi:hypothetical protein